MGGALGALVIDKTNDSTTSGRTNGGLADVTTVTDAPLPTDGRGAPAGISVLPRHVPFIAQSSGSDAAGRDCFGDQAVHGGSTTQVDAGGADGAQTQTPEHQPNPHTQ